MSYPQSQALIRMPFDPADLNATLEARYAKYLDERLRVHLAAKNLLDSVYDAMHEPCDRCLSERVIVSYTVDPGVARALPCDRCRRGEYAETVARLARCANCGALPGDEGCAECKEPPTLRTGEAPRIVCPYSRELYVDEDQDDGIERRDPFDLSSEELVAGAIRLTAREMCDGEGGRGSGIPSLKGDRAGLDDPRDTNDDIQPFERTTLFPWGPK